MCYHRMFEYLTSYSVDHALYSSDLCVKNFFLKFEQLLLIQMYINRIQIKACVLHRNPLPSRWLSLVGSVTKGTTLLLGSTFVFFTKPAVSFVR